jgi:hypothetical protein
VQRFVALQPSGLAFRTARTFSLLEGLKREVNSRDCPHSCYRFNRREDADILEQTVSRMAGVKAMPYRKLVERNTFTPFIRPWLLGSCAYY